MSVSSMVPTPSSTSAGDVKHDAEHVLGDPVEARRVGLAVERPEFAGLDLRGERGGGA